MSLDSDVEIFHRIRCYRLRHTLVQEMTISGTGGKHQAEKGFRLAVGQCARCIPYVRERWLDIMWIVETVRLADGTPLAAKLEGSHGARGRES